MNHPVYTYHPATKVNKAQIKKNGETLLTFEVEVFTLRQMVKILETLNKGE